MLEATWGERMQNPRVTIGVRFHRGGNEDWLHQALDSVQKQTYPHYHTILLIDGEEVFAEDLAKRFGKPYLCTNVHPHISHMSQLHRMGLGSCQTEFYKPLDFDDQLFPEYLEYAVQKMDSLNLDLYSCRMKHLCGQAC